MLYNVLNFPAGVVRMTKVTQEDDQLMKDYPDYDLRHRLVKKVSYTFSKAFSKPTEKWDRNAP